MNGTTIHVQLELDAIPRPSAPAQRSRGSFAEALRSVEPSAELEQRPATERVDTRNPRLESEEPVDRLDHEPAACREALPEPASSHHDAGDVATATAPAATPVERDATPVGRTAGHECTPQTSDGDSGRRIAAGKGPESPSTLTATAPADDASAATPQLPGAPGAAVVARPSAGSAAPSGWSRIEALHGSRAASTRGAAPTYRTFDLRAAEQLQRASDSMFKRIAMKLLPDGGQMRMRLDPPLLGQLDVNLVVEKGAVVLLSLAAERPELNGMLEKQIPELRQLLASEGFDVSQAEVCTHEFGASSRDHDRSTGQDMPEPRRSDATPAKPTRPVAWSADGLDFWA